VSAAAQNAVGGGVVPFKAMIMAAGFGTRLLPLTESTAKPMVPILNRPVMEHILRLLRHHGVQDVAVNLHYHPDDIKGYFGDGGEFGLRMRYVVERDLLGTAGGVGGFRAFFADDTFVVVSGDALTDIDLTAFVAAHRASGGIATMAVMPVADPSKYGVVVHDRQSRVTGFQEKPTPDEARSSLCNCGIYALEPRIFDYIPAGTFVDFGRDVFPALLDAGEPFYAWQLRTYWNDVGNIEQYRVGNFDALTGRVHVDVPGTEVAPGVHVGADSVIAASVTILPPVLIGDRCHIGPQVNLNGPLIIGDDCVIEEGATLDDVIHWDGATTGHHALSFGSILGHGVTVHHHAVICEGAVVGDGSEVADRAVVASGARVQPNTKVMAEGSGGTEKRPADAGGDGCGDDLREGPVAP
jgi:mannose-1-phosphate guanylyltransferase/phosphomannomutase